MYKFSSELFLASATITYLQRAHKPKVDGDSREVRGYFAVTCTAADASLVIWGANTELPQPVSSFNQTILMLSTPFFQFVCPGIAA